MQSYVCVCVLLSEEKTRLVPEAARIGTTSGRKIRGEHVSVRKTGFFAMEMEYPQKLSITVYRAREGMRRSFSCSKVGLDGQIDVEDIFRIRIVGTDLVDKEKIVNNFQSDSLDLSLSRSIRLIYVSNQNIDQLIFASSGRVRC